LETLRDAAILRSPPPPSTWSSALTRQLAIGLPTRSNAAVAPHGASISGTCSSTRSSSSAEAFSTSAPWASAPCTAWCCSGPERCSQSAALSCSSSRARSGELPAPGAERLPLEPASPPGSVFVLARGCAQSSRCACAQDSGTAHSPPCTSSLGNRRADGDRHCNL